ncbi:hypothetical protein [Trichococcus shcherbakoviae]|uniref:hypothetical protein n=1 Tax=Trichococcus shcherbakoviae TaxID=2094020 RepID=UPI002AA7FA96|nr:hypothetical protein [Trichococcus shcherbakoviae]
MIDENKAQGFIALYRSIETSPTFKALDVIQQSIAIRLLLHANYKDNEWFDNGQQKMIVIKRGQLITSRASIKKWFNNDPLVTEQRIRTALTKLEKLDFLTKEATKYYTLITICHYNDYQPSKEQTNQPSNQVATRHQPSSNQVATTNNNVNNVNNVKNEKNKDNTSNQDSSEERFNEIWKLYPKKTMKKEALAVFKKVVKKGTDPDVIKNGIERYLADLDKNTWKKPMDGGRWFQKERWNDEYEGPKQQKGGENNYEFLGF